MSRSSIISIAFSLLFFVRAGADPLQDGQAPVCKFSYTTNVQDQLVIPELRKNFGEGYVYFDYDRPVVDMEGGRAIVQLSATRTVDGRSLQFEDLFFVEIDPCEFKVLASYSTNQYQKVDQRP